jgi:LPS-assembly protein
MQIKILFLLFSTTSFLFGEIDNRLYFLSGEVGVDGNNVVAYKNATALFEEKYMSAETIIYNQENRDIEFFGDVSLIEKGLYFFVGDYAKVSIDGNASIKNMFLYHKPRHIWIYADESNATNDKFSLKHTFLSSCRSENPDWGFYIEEGYYDKKKQFFELYNVLLYATDIPILYIPYLNFSTNRERKSGLLVPEVGVYSREGFYYSQPIYIVPNEWSDWEITPQIRTSRGEGIYLDYRFVDSPYSKGYITTGIFHESKSYYSEYNLANREHYGLEIYYKSENAFAKLDDSFLLDIKYLNDIDYLYLKQYKSSGIDITNLIESKLNYFLEKNNHSFGIYNRYVIDTSKSSNGDTLQTLPHLQYHYGISPFWNQFLYSFDYNYKNIWRERGVTATQHEITIPVTLYGSFFNDYLRFKVTENFYSSYIDFSHTDEYQDNQNFYLRHYHQIEVFTDLGKKYKNGSFHSIDFGANLILPDIEKKSGFYTPVIQDSETCEVGNACEFQREDKIDSTLELKFSQYFHDKNGKEVFFHNFLQPIVVEDGKIISLDVLENEFKYNFSEELSLYNGFDYSFHDGEFKKLSSTLQYGWDSYKFDISHYLKREDGEEDLESISTELSLKLNDKYSLFGHYSYDLMDESTRSWGFGYNMKKRCWNYKLHYKEEYHPYLANDGTTTLKDSMLYFLIELYPLGGFDYEFK